MQMNDTKKQIALSVRIKRQDAPGARPYFQTFAYSGDGRLTAADFLRQLNENENLTDSSGAPARPVKWECSCLEKKCGACAMLINGRPGLACGTFLRDVAASRRGGIVTLEPLSRFPVIRDLVVDRSSMFEMLNKMKLWLGEMDWTAFNRSEELEFSSGQCIMCGCCLEACPNFTAGRDFGGAAAMNAAFKLLEQHIRDGHFREMTVSYMKHFFNGCGQSFSCSAVCPVKLPLEDIQAYANNYALKG